jgi:hypothetical protein
MVHGNCGVNKPEKNCTDAFGGGGVTSPGYSFLRDIDVNIAQSVCMFIYQRSQQVAVNLILTHLSPV